MDIIWPALGAAFALGATHALEVDHMVTVTTFVGRRPRVLSAIGYGLRWGLRHALVVFAVGSLLAVSGLRMPEPAVRWAELGVGVMLIALGVWAAWGARRLHVHAPGVLDGHAEDHIHLHVHPASQHPHHHHDPSAGQRHRHLSTLIGAAHGLAGSGPVVALIPVTILGRPAAAIGYLATFGVGTMLAMAAYAALAALAVGRATRSERAARLAAGLTGLMSLGVGAWWVVGAMTV